MLLKNTKLKMKLQFFADPTPPADPLPVDPLPVDPVPTPGGVEFNKDQQSEVDRRISKAVESALEKNQSKTDALIAEKVKAAADKAAEYATLTEAQKQEKLLSEREANISKAEEEIKIGRLRSAVETDLSKEGLPTSIAEVLVKLNDAEAIKKMVTELKGSLDEKVNEAVKEKLRQSTPLTGSSIKTSSLSGSLDMAAIAAKHRIIGKD